jgi:cobyrinic acid a,c-diamide synthase
VVSQPRLVLAAPSSSSGKTTISIGLMAALSARGLGVAPFKVGPDYIDPGYHQLATGRPGRNLDAWLCGTELIAPLFAHGAQGSDLGVVEGVMGLYDGRLGQTEGRRGFGSTAHVAELLAAPVVLVADARGVSRTLAATCLGLAKHPQAPRVAGVILNRVGSQRAVTELRDAFTEVGIQVLGAVPRTAEVHVPSRHLGLVPAAERDQAEAVVRTAAELVNRHVDLDAVLEIAQQAKPLGVDPWVPQVEQVEGRPRVAVAAGRAFTFRYAETTELLSAAGCEVVEFDPLCDAQLPAGSAALYLGGGFPEVHAEELAANRPLLADIRAGVEAGLPTVAECAGLLYLCRSLDGMDMANVLPLDAQMSARLTLGYRSLRVPADSVITKPDEAYRSHEFHRTTTMPSTGTPAGALSPAFRSENGLDGLAGPSLLASYQHIHWAGYPQLAQRFAQAAADFAAAGTRWAPASGVKPTPEPDLRHHGDAQARPGLTDLAVNVHNAPDWLLRQVAAAPERWQAYPDPAPAEQALAARHHLSTRQLLTCAGAAEAFTLIARSFPDRKVAIIHPQFTEPEVAWRTARHDVRRLVLRRDEGFQLEAARVSDDINLVVIGNPTNPTGVLHPASEIRRLRRPGRIVVVDEAFMDFVDSEPESLLKPGTSGEADLEGFIVIRSLTKLWGIAGLRTGFIAGDAELISELRAQQEPWAVSTPALDAICAISSAEAALEQARVTRQVEADREYLATRLEEAGFEVLGNPQTPFVLIDTAPVGPDSLHLPLADHGFAVRRCDTFPGLGPTWLRLAVRDRSTTDALLTALQRVRAQES